MPKSRPSTRCTWMCSPSHETRSMTGICVRARSVTATALLPLEQPFSLVFLDDAKDSPNLWISVTAGSLEDNGAEPDLGAAIVAGHVDVGSLCAVAHAKAEDEPSFLPECRHSPFPRPSLALRRAITLSAPSGPAVACFRGPRRHAHDVVNPPRGCEYVEGHPSVVRGPIPNRAPPSISGFS